VDHLGAASIISVRTASATACSWLSGKSRRAAGSDRPSRIDGPSDSPDADAEDAGEVSPVVSCRDTEPTSRPEGKHARNCLAPMKKIDLP
ncbi:hypothetical protein, partial [Methylobacterium sp. Leaf117]|uniref:hypothetical protein n=1 Tax=Methylobacterium sp. Leaf117 TaxID=1736260 RepID=UPI001AEC0FC2